MNQQSQNSPAMTHSRFLTSRGGGNSWARNGELIDAFARADFYAVPPLALEFAPLLECNASCPRCPFARRRREAHLEKIALTELPNENDVTLTRLDTARRILDRVIGSGVTGVLWTGGGEPTIWRPLVEAMHHSATLGMDNALYTNGLRFGYDPEFASSVLAPENRIVFVRVSVNAVTAHAARLHWGLGSEDLEFQFTGLHNLFSARAALAERGDCRAALPSIQISTIVDKNTIDDLSAICQRVAKIASDFPHIHGSEDVMVVRPLTIHGHAQFSEHDHEDNVIREILRICGRAGDGHAVVEQAGLSLFLGFGLARVESGEAPDYSSLIREEYAQRDVSWSNGVFLTVGPAGRVYLSTSHNCDPRWELGDLRIESVSEIYRGTRRRRIVEEANRLRWGPTVEQATARTNRLDRVARAIMSGELSSDEIEVIRSASLSSHGLLLD